MKITARHLDQYLAEFHPGTTEAAEPVFFTIRAGLRHQMSQDNISYLLNKHATAAHQDCSEVPEKIHAHQLRHARAMQMLRAGVPLRHLKEFLGHANISTTSIYASADNQMVREVIQRAGSSTPDLAPLWTGGDELILQLAGLSRNVRLTLCCACGLPFRAKNSRCSPSSAANCGTATDRFESCVLECA